jgi:hypothetical protein
MSDVTPFNNLAVFLRDPIEIPSGLRLVTDPVQPGWSLLRSGNSPWLDQQIRSHGWHFICIANKSIGSGASPSLVKATASALDLALRNISPNFNAATIAHHSIKKYAWFSVVQLSLFPYQIQPSPSLSTPATQNSLSPRRRAPRPTLVPKRVPDAL